MLMHTKRLLLALAAGAALAASPTVAPAQSPAAPATVQWHATETPKESAWVFTEDASSGERIDVRVRDGHVYVSTNRPVSVKVITILGQPVATRNMQAGTMRLRLPFRGIYILKAGETTRRINI